MDHSNPNIHRKTYEVTEKDTYFKTYVPIIILSLCLAILLSLLINMKITQLTSSEASNIFFPIANSNWLSKKRTFWLLC